MPRASRIIVADADSKHAQLLAFGFEREGLAAHAVRTADDVKRQVDVGDVAGVVLSLPSPKLAVDALRRLRSQGPHMPVVALGDPAGKQEVVAAGATDFLPRPAFVRDVVALLRFHGTARAGTGAPTAWTGDLAEFAGTLYLIRALAAAGRTGVMTIVRGLRRAELRYHAGEVTSAQVGSLHGLAALHQLLLWTEGKLDFRSESVVRRQQIPLSPAELFDDCGRFLREFHDLAPDLSPGTVLVQDLARVSQNVDKIPKEVSPVLRLFDGARLLSDVIEDAPFRVFDTLKITTRLVRLGVLKVDVPRARSQPAALKVDDWLVGHTPVTGVPALPVPRTDTGPVGPPPGVPASPPAAAPAPVVSAPRKKRTSRERPAVQPPADAPAVASAPGAPATDDWGPLPGATGSIWDVPDFAPVVPSQVTTGELKPADRPAPELVAAAKVIAEDLGVPPRTPVPTVVLGTARERVDEISAPVMPVVTIMPASAGARARSPSTPPPAANQAAPIIAVLPAARPPSAPVLPSVEPEPVEAAPAAPMTAMPTEPTAPQPVPAPFVPPPPAEPVQVAAQGELVARAAAPTRPSQEIASIVIEAEEPPPEVSLRIERDELDAAIAEQAAAAPLVETTTLAAAIEAPVVPEPPPPSVLVSLPELASTAALAASAVEQHAFAPPAAPVLPAAPVVPTASDFTVPAATPPPPALPRQRTWRPTPAPGAVEASDDDAAPIIDQVSLGTGKVETTDRVGRDRRRSTGPEVRQKRASSVPPTTSERARRSSAPPLAARADQEAAAAAEAAARAVGFDDIDEEFFSQESKFAEAQAHKVETFDDLEPGGYRRPEPQGGFWKRMFGSAPDNKKR